jgi:hypothetical protein
MTDQPSTEDQMSLAMKAMASHVARSERVDRTGWTDDQWIADAQRLMDDLDGSVLSLVNGHVLALLARVAQSSTPAPSGGGALTDAARPACTWQICRRSPNACLAWCKCVCHDFAARAAQPRTPTAVEALADQWNETPDYTASEYDQGRVDQRHAMTEQLLAALAQVETQPSEDKP